MPKEANQSKPFPFDGKTRAKRNAEYLGIGVSTWWLYVKQGRIAPPIKYGKRVSVWDASYVRLLGSSGVPEAGEAK